MTDVPWEEMTSRWKDLNLAETHDPTQEGKDDGHHALVQVVAV